MRERESNDSSTALPMAKERDLTALDKSALETSPPPVKKVDWKDAAGITKKPAVKPMHKPAAAAAGPAKGLKDSAHQPAKGLKGLAHGPAKGLKGSAHGPAKGLEKVLIHKDTVTTGGGKNQAYIQHVPGPGTNKRLIAAVTKTRASRTTKTHAELVELLLPACKKRKATKADVLTERDNLLQKFAK